MPQHKLDHVASDAASNRFAERAAFEIESVALLWLAMAYSDEQVASDRRMVMQATYLAGPALLETLVPNDSNDPARRKDVLRNIHHALDRCRTELRRLQPKIFSVIGPLKGFSFAAIRTITANFLSDHPEIAYDIGHYFETISPTRIPLDKRRNAADKVLDSIAEQIAHRPSLITELRANLDELFARAAEDSHQQAIPKKAPELWENRSLGSGETSLIFTRRVYARWLPAPLAIADLRILDPSLYLALKKWTGRHQIPPELEAFFGAGQKRRSRKEVEAELARYKIKKPSDAFERFPNDPKRARRLYQAAKARL